MQHVLLIVTGGIAAYKTPELVRYIKKSGRDVRVIMTKAAHEFVTPMTLATLSGDKVFTDLFDLKDESEIGHIQLSREADLVVVAPATANTLAKLANGIADNLATTCLLATNKPVLIAPAMNVKMWEHPATQHNTRQLKQNGIQFIGPDNGDMACGEFGEGRMAEPEIIFDKIEKQLEQNNSAKSSSPLMGKKVLVTAGPTREAIDPVRYLSNHSSGKQGYEIALAAEKAGAEVHLVLGPVCFTPSAELVTHPVVSALDMHKTCIGLLEEHEFSAAFCVAAVSDWRPKTLAETKIKKDAQNNTPPSLELTENPDILASIAYHEKQPDIVVGFAAETNNLIENAQQKRQRKNCDMIVANEISQGNPAFGQTDNIVHLITKEEIRSLPRQSKAAISDKLIQFIIQKMDQS